MEIAGIGLEQFSDIGFALLIGGICLRTLLFDRDANAKQRAIWKHELLELEKSLKTLIDESTDACELFDKKLDRRQKNIEALLDRAEITASEVFAKVTVSANSAKRNATILKDKPVAQKVEVAKPDWEIGDDLPDELPNHLIDALDAAEDTAVLETKVKEKKVIKETAENFVQKIEEVPLAVLSDERIFSQTSIVDPIAFKIAKRLLLEGKELHVIARKLEIPVSEIRHLESLIRQNAQAEKAELPQSFLSKEIDNVKKVIRDPAVRKNTEKLLADNIETLRNERPLLAFELEEENESPLFGR